MLYANTDDGSSALWVCDGNGVVVDNISYSIGDRAPILEKINEHYGTSFTGWSDNEIGLRLGDTIPDWDAYEKIEITRVNVKIENNNNTYAFGTIVGDTIILVCQDENNFFSAYENGQIYGANSGASSYVQYAAIPQINNSGYNVTQYQINVESYQIGDIIPNWADYVKIPR